MGMAEKVLETDFPLIAPPNPPLSVHPRLVASREHGRNGSLKRAYSSEEVTPLRPSGGSDTSDYLSDSLAPPGYQTLPPDSISSNKTDTLSLPPFRPPTHRIRQQEEEDEASVGTRCCYGFLYAITQIFLHAPVALILYWIIQYKQHGKGKPFAWQGGDEDNSELELTWNLHPFLMVTGLIYFMGQGMLVYRTCTCCRRIYANLFHSLLHLLAVPCIVIAFLAVWDYHALAPKPIGPIPHFYSVHSWLGLAAMALFSLQLLLGLFSFLLLLTCEEATAGFRARLVPVHAIFGTATFGLAIATSVCGIQEKVFFETGGNYTRWVNVVQNLTPLEEISEKDQQAIILNVTAGSLAVLAVLMPCLLWYPKFRFRSEV